MIPMIQVILLSYIDKYNGIDLSVLQKELNEPVELIINEILSLFERGYIKKIENDFVITDKVQAEDLMSWNEVVSKKEEEVLTAFHDGTIKIRDKERPFIESVNQLIEIFELGGVDLEAYHEFQISKEDKTRVIMAPSKPLKLRQRYILDYFLKCEKIPDCVHGFTESRSIVTNAACHVNKKQIGCLDIKDFFPSISDSMVKLVFEDFGYSEEVADVFTRLCTFKNQVPQGAPTSPMISNLVFKPIDEEIVNYANNAGIIYSRYADDITISSDEDISPHMKEIESIIFKHGFVINADKTHVMKDNYRKIVTGLVVSDRVRVPKVYKRRMRQELYYCKQFGIEQHLKNRGKRSAVNYKEYMYGKAYFVKMVEPEIGEEFLRELDEIFSVY